jgi:uncharacterized protein (TIGR02598 family)
MKLLSTPRSDRPTATAAFSLIEVMVAMAIVGVVFVSLYGGISSGFAVVSVARENLRATQVMQDRMEEMRLYTWDQITSFGTSTSYIPSSFTEPYYPDTSTNLSLSDLTETFTATATVGGTTRTTTAQSNSTSGFSYSGTIAISNSGLTESYSNDLRMVIVTVAWTNGTVRRERTMTSFVSQYGMHNYLW